MPLCESELDSLRDALSTYAGFDKLPTVDSNESEKSVTLHLSAPEVGGTIPLSRQAAYVLGGVPAYT